MAWSESRVGTGVGRNLRLGFAGLQGLGDSESGAAGRPRRPSESAEGCAATVRLEPPVPPRVRVSVIGSHCEGGNLAEPGASLSPEKPDRDPAARSSDGVRPRCARFQIHQGQAGRIGDRDHHAVTAWQLSRQVEVMASASVRVAARVARTESSSHHRSRSVALSHVTVTPAGPRLRPEPEPQARRSPQASQSGPARRVPGPS